MQQIIYGIQIVLALLIVGAILLQTQGTGFGSGWSGGGESYHTRRGMEKMMFFFTIIATGLFAVLATVTGLIL